MTVPNLITTIRIILAPIFYLSVYYLTALFTISSGLHYMHFWFKTMGDGGGNHYNIP